MGRFYIRVYQDGEKVRSTGCGSCTANNQKLISLVNMIKYQVECNRSRDAKFKFNTGTAYTFCLMRKTRNKKVKSMYKIAYYDVGSDKFTVTETDTITLPVKIEKRYEVRLDN